MTKKMQKNELGTLTIGADMTPLAILVPPKADKFNLNYYCNKECVSKVWLFFIFNKILLQMEMESLNLIPSIQIELINLSKN